MNKQLILRRDHWLVRLLCAARGRVPFVRVEACRVQYDTQTFVRVFVTKN